MQEKMRQEGDALKSSASVGTLQKRSFLASSPDSAILTVKPSLLKIDKSKKLGVGTYA
jgi:hypothetical protein